mmetsp:Transcript_5582/g.12183  ORF Transcript_5582/g.12183 Transcript_5582/m.12183 type:complete len:107 (-) Transcript_5582:621-941(-)
MTNRGFGATTRWQLLLPLATTGKMSFTKPGRRCETSNKQTDGGTTTMSDSNKGVLPTLHALRCWRSCNHHHYAVFAGIDARKQTRTGSRFILVRLRGANSIRVTRK